MRQDKGNNQYERDIFCGYTYTNKEPRQNRVYSLSPRKDPIHRIKGDQNEECNNNAINYMITKASTQFIDIKKAVEVLSDLVRSQQTDVTFSVNEEADTPVIKVTKTETGELIKQFPPEEILAMIVRLRKNIGWLVDKKA